MKKIGTLKTYKSSEIEDSIVSIGFECLDRKLFNPERCYGPLAESGVKYARVQTGWAVCETERGVYDFKWLDDIVDKLIAGGIKPWFNVGFGNPLYMPNVPNPTAVGCVPLYYGDEATNAWLSFVGALTRHFASRIKEYEIWNESDMKQFWYPNNPDADAYARLISITGRVIRENQPDARIGANTASSYFDYVGRLAELLNVGELDFYCLHKYSVFPELEWFEKVREIGRQFKRRGHNIKLWMGEGGYPSWFPKGHWMHPYPDNDGSERQQAVYQLRRYFQDASLGLERSSFFQMVDMWERPYEKAQEVLKKPAAQGILNGITYTKKQAYYTISRLGTLLSGAVEPLDAFFDYKLEGASRTETVSVQRFCFKRKNKPMYVYYLPTDIQKEVDVDYKFSFYTLAHDVEPIESPVLIDPYNGNVYEIESPRFWQGIAATGLPIAEYPLIICDCSMYEIIPAENA